MYLSIYESISIGVKDIEIYW